MSCVGSKTASGETELAEMEEAHTCNVADMCRQRQVLVDNDSKVTESARRLDAGVRQLKQVNSAVRYTTNRPKPDDFRLGRIETQAVIHSLSTLQYG